MSNRLLLATVLVSLGAIARPVDGDALVVTRAMQAATIVEIFIEPQAARVELEISAADMIAFQDLLPEQVYEELDREYVPLDQRHKRFIREGLVLRDERNTRLPGRVESTEVRRRIIRDEITGEPLAVQPADAELVLLVALRYEFIEQPTTLTIQRKLAVGSQAPDANIGFVCYHKGLPVNDFRFLPTAASLDLDWSDPWYSRFRHPNLRRQFAAPVSAYLYVEPFEVRKEIIVRPRDLQRWLDLGIADDGVVRVDQQDQLKKRVADFLSTKNPVTVDGQPVAGKLDRIHFIQRTLRTAGVIDPPQDLNATSATLGVIFVYPIDRLPDEVSMQWELFGPNFLTVPAVASDEAGGLPATLTPDEPELVWTNFLTDPQVPTMMPVNAPEPPTVSVSVMSVLCFGLALLLLPLNLSKLTRGQRTPRGALLAMATMVAIGVVCLPHTQASLPSPVAGRTTLDAAQAEDVLHALLYNVYRAFDRRDESLVYDRLARSISGSLLNDVYLQVRQSIELENQGGARVKVDDVNVLEVTQVDEGELAYRCQWTASGSVGHWGHIHRRTNHYTAIISIQPAEVTWKIARIDLEEERRIDPNLINKSP